MTPGRITRFVRGAVRYGAIALFAMLVCVSVPAWSSGPPSGASEPSVVNAVAQNPIQLAQQRYEAGQYAEALTLLRQGLQTTSDPVGQAVVLSNLALTYQQLGNWEAAQDSLDQALALLQSEDTDGAPDPVGVWAQALDVQGSLDLATGEAESAMESWEQSARLFDQANQPYRAALSRINQAQALQTLGLYRRAIALLKDVYTVLASDESNSPEMAAALRSLGEAQRIAGSFSQADVSLSESLAIAQSLGDSEAIAQSYLSLGNLARSRINSRSLLGVNAVINEGFIQVALRAYEQTASASSQPMTQVQANLNRLSLLTDLERWNDAAQLYPQIQPRLGQLPPGRLAIFAQVNFAQSVMRLKQGQPSVAIAWSDIAQILSTAYQRAIDLQDSRAQSFALGQLGEVYEQTGQGSEAQDLTRQALALSQSVNAQDIAYRWQWQLGRLLKEEGEYAKAVSAYAEAFNTLQLLRADLVAANADVKFSFRKSVEPVYREFVDLLLRPIEGTPPPQVNLQQARDVMEALQVAQLENFFQAACLEPKLQIDRVIAERNQRAAVVYPIILDDRLEVILKLPDDDQLIHYTPINKPRREIEETLRAFRRDLQGLYTYRRVKEQGQIIYEWLVGQADERLVQNQIETLIFVLDGSFRNVPMAALYDGQHYLAERYAVDLVLGLEVSNPQPLERDDLRVLAAGLVEPPPEFRNLYARLDNVKVELELIDESGMPVTLLQEENFKRRTFNEEFNKREFQVVHLATHGQFGADRESTFILDADGKVLLDDLSELFGTDRQGADAPIQLLIMSACRTATGDDQEVLGIAGTTVRAGARSAIASLWSLDDQASVGFTRELYQHLGEPGVTRAEAVRRAQVAMMGDLFFNHPRYWSPYVLVGSWL